MPGLLLMNVFDVARALGITPLLVTPEEVADWLLSEYLRKRGGGFNYDPAINATYDLFRGIASRDQAILHCLTKGNPKGRRQNTEAIKCIADYALANVCRCERISFTAVAVGRVKGATVYAGIKAPMLRILNEEAFIVMPGYRMSHRPVEAEIDVACSIALDTFSRDDRAGADFEYLYAGPDQDGQRQFRAIKGRDRKILSRETLDGLMDTFVKGVALAIEAGAEPKKPDLRGYRVVDPRQPSVF
jgi:hypothetical protein